MTPTRHPVESPSATCRYRLGFILVGLLLLFEIHCAFGQLATKVPVTAKPATANRKSVGRNSRDC